ncbi:MAG: acyl-CoA dehydrogenase family protein [Bacteroidales bacterium]
MSSIYVLSDNKSIATVEDPQSFIQFLKEFQECMRRAFNENFQIKDFAGKRGYPPQVLRELMSGTPMAVCIPREYGGIGSSMEESIHFESSTAYESLTLSLMLGINTALFIQPVVRYGQEAVKQRIFNQFLNHQAMGGLMITEPDYGSDALNMQASFTESDHFYHVLGQKHWAGLTGQADFWLLTARKRTPAGDLMRDIDIFICEEKVPGQNIDVEEYFENLGLYQIRYGRNNIDVFIPSEQRLIPKSTGIKMLLDLLHRSRFQFAGMGHGFIRRILDEAINHTKTRKVSNHKLFEYDQVQQRLSRLQSNFTVLSAFCLKSGEFADFGYDVSGMGLEANVIKTVSSDYMQESAQSLLQLVGARGYKQNDFAGQAIVDSRPFQIFEGSNDILYHQIAESVMKMMRVLKEKSLFEFLKGYAARAAGRLQDLVSFDLNFDLPQRKLVELGTLLSRIISMDHVVYLGEKGYRKDLIENAIEVLKQDISTILKTFTFNNQVKVVVDYQEGSQWFGLGKNSGTV